MPVTTASKSSTSEAFYPQVQQRMVQSGEWDRILQIMTSKLNESGWTDGLRHYSKEKARAMNPLSFQALADDLSLHAKTSLPLAVRREVTTLIRQYVEKQIES